MSTITASDLSPGLKAALGASPGVVSTYVNAWNAAATSSWGLGSTAFCGQEAWKAVTTKYEQSSANGSWSLKQAPSTTDNGVTHHSDGQVAHLTYKAAEASYAAGEISFEEFGREFRAYMADMAARNPGAVAELRSALAGEPAAPSEDRWDDFAKSIHLK